MMIRNSITCLLVAVSGLTATAYAQSSEGPPAVGVDPPPPLIAPNPAPPAAEKQPALPGLPAATQDKGPPGMMGNPWPKSPEEADKTLNVLFGHLKTTNDALLAGQIAVSIEKLWRLPAGDTVNLLIDRAASFSAKNENDKALKLLDAAVDLAPDYAEAWNRRAFVQYRLENATGALADLRRVLALEPNHFRALDGMAKILDGLGEKKNALKAYDQLLKVYPEIEGAKESADELRKAVEGQGI